MVDTLAEQNLRKPTWENHGRIGLANGTHTGIDPLHYTFSATSRLGVVLGNEAIRMLSEGVASASDIDTAMRLGYRHPMGPLELSDLVGLDVRRDILNSLADAFNDDSYRPHPLLEMLVESGELGKKTGRGIYDWASGEKVERV